MLSYSISQLILMFFIYAFLGWCCEVVIATVQTKEFVNRGFLNGPYCPVYGFGVIAILYCLTPIRENALIFFFAAILIATAIEFITGYILEKNFNRKWWDYSNERFNVKGYVCLGTSIVWGFANLFVFYILQPSVDVFIGILPKNIEIAIAVFLSVVIFTDTIITIISLTKVKQKLRIMEETGDRIKFLSDKIGKNISDNTISALNMSDKSIQELDNLKKKYQDVLNMPAIGYKRFAKAFPKLGLTKLGFPKSEKNHKK